MNYPVAVINGFVLFSTDIYITSVQFCVPLSMVRVKIWWEIVIEVSFL